MSVSAILLAAGESTRMGSLKALLPWSWPGVDAPGAADRPGEGTTLLERQVAALRASGCAEVVVVLGHAAERLLPLLAALAESAGPAVRPVLNPDYRRGKTTSIRVGVEALAPDATAALLLGVDQPRPAWLLAEVLRGHRAAGAAITVPVQAGRRGHPPVFAAALFPELRELSEERQGLREVLARHAAAVHLLSVASPLVHADLNRPADYTLWRGES